jgi:hypothetical protein
LVGAPEGEEGGGELGVDLQSVLQLDDGLVVLALRGVLGAPIKVALLLDIRILGEATSVNSSTRQVAPSGGAVFIEISGSRRANPTSIV